MKKLLCGCTSKCNEKDEEVSRKMDLTEKKTLLTENPINTTLTLAPVKHEEYDPNNGKGDNEGADDGIVEKIQIKEEKIDETIEEPILRRSLDNTLDPNARFVIANKTTGIIRSSKTKKPYNSVSFRYRPPTSCMPKNDSFPIGSTYANRFPMRRGSMIVRSSTTRNNANANNTTMNNNNNGNLFSDSINDKFNSHLSRFTNDSLIFTPFAQVLVSLRKVRMMFIKLTGATSKSDQMSLVNIPEENIEAGTEEYNMAAIETLDDLEWCLSQLESIQTKRPVSNMASTKFKKLLNRELSQYYAQTDRTSAQISDYISQTFLDKESEDKEDDSDSNEEDNEQVINPTNTAASSLSIQITHDEPSNVESKTMATVKSFSTLNIHNKTSHTRDDSATDTESKDSLEKKIPPYGVKVKDEAQLDELMKDGLDNWGLDIFKVNDLTFGFPLTTIFYRILKQRNLFRLINIDPVVMINYVTQVEKSYDSNVPYHNSIHAADVTQSSHVLLSAETLDDIFTDFELFAIIFACAIHDVSHPGVTNQFLINSGHELALLYNDASVLENYHLSVAFKLMLNKDSDIFAKLAVKQKQSLRRMVIDLVLATDMSKHMNLLADLKTMVETKKISGSGILDLDSYTDRLQVLQNLIHCADLSNPTKPLDLYKKWTDKIMEEFFLQGDRERNLKLDISPMCDRSSVAIEKTQLSFIDFIVHPLWETWCEFVHPSSQGILDILEENREWYQSQLSESSPTTTEEQGKEVEEK